eukprot:COSAG02_NODE_2007_length_10128_cov_5.313989_8_plen_58_part_00
MNLFLRASAFHASSTRLHLKTMTVHTLYTNLRTLRSHLGVVVRDTVAFNSFLVDLDS